jgi:hypothetical protein
VLKRLCATGAVAAVTTGALLLGGPAHAGSLIENVHVNAPIDVCGNNAQVIGDLGAASCGPASGSGY